MVPYSFIILAFVALVSAMAVVYCRNPMYSALWLVVTLVSIAGIYLMLNAEFVAAIQVIVYAGGILILYAFVIMLVDLSGEAGPRPAFHRPLQVGAAFAMATLVGGFVLWITKGGVESFSVGGGAEGVAADSTRALAQELFLKYLYPFEIASFLLLTAMIGSVVLARRLTPSAQPEEEKES
jgi:NADH-quinone oxidoreductase subunit J